MTRIHLRLFFATLVALLLAPPLAAQESKDEAPPAASPSVTEPQVAPPFEPKERVQLRINIPATRLDLYVNDQLKKSYRVAVGMPKYPTPVTDLSISYIVWNPWWIPPDSEWAKDAEKTPPGPGNPLGPVKMMMDQGIRIHGTNAPGSVGRAASHACMRMKSSEARELAWEIQQRYSDKLDPQLLETYKKNSRSTYWVKLLSEVPVTIEYKQVEVLGEKILIHPDRYGKGGFQQELEGALAAHPDIIVDKSLLKKLNQQRRSGTAEFTVAELKALTEPPPAPPGPGSGGLTPNPLPGNAATQANP